jgi:hypothetical protein
MPGVVYQDHGARADIIADKPEEHIDRGDANNLISPENGTSQNCWNMASNGFLVQLEKVSMTRMEDWRTRYPEAYEREYDPIVGLRFNAWVEGGI